MASDHSMDSLDSKRELFEEIAKQQEEYKKHNPHKITDAEIVACFEGDDKLRTGNSIANELGVHSKTIYRRLRKLEDKYILESYDLGPVRAWCLNGTLWKSYLSESTLKRLRGSMGEEYE